MVEQSMELIARADWIIDLGPEGGAGGGELVFQGIPAQIVHCESSKTGRFLRSMTE
jgi:excinuclease UvrABC ATPase subunit